MNNHAEAVFLIQAAVLIGIPYALWQIKAIRSFMPLVVIQVLLGIVLGPSLFGYLAPDLFNQLFAPDSLKVLSGVGWLGVCMLGFLTGLHFDLSEVAKRGFKFFFFSLSTMIVPMALGALLAYGIYASQIIPIGVHPAIFIFGMSIAFGVTALPVLSAILIEMRLIDTSIGQRVLGYATLNDAMLWVFVAVLAAVTASGSAGDASSVVSTTLLMLVRIFGFLAIMYLAVRPLLGHAYDKGWIASDTAPAHLAILLSLAFVCAIITQVIGVHFLLGAFIFGIMLPAPVKRRLHGILDTFTMVVLMPFYFMLVGLQTSFSFSDSSVWVLFGAATFVAVIGKMLGTALPDYYINRSGLAESLRAGALMQTKGLMEVIVLNIMLAAHIITPTVFTAMLLMAVATTFLTKPLMLLIAKILSSPPPQAPFRPAAQTN